MKKRTKGERNHNNNNNDFILYKKKSFVWKLFSMEGTCGQVYFGRPLPVSQDAELRQFDLLAHANTTQSISPQVTDISHRVTDLIIQMFNEFQICICIFGFVFYFFLYFGYFWYRFDSIHFDLIHFDLILIIVNSWFH